LFQSKLDVWVMSYQLSQVHTWCFHRLQQTSAVPKRNLVSLDVENFFYESISCYSDRREYMICFLNKFLKSMLLRSSRDCFPKNDASTYRKQCFRGTKICCHDWTEKVINNYLHFNSWKQIIISQNIFQKLRSCFAYISRG
jgi:hypothetical protein